LKFYRIPEKALEEPDAVWEYIYEDPEFRSRIRERVIADCASGDPRRMHWDEIPITRKGEETTYISAMNIPIPWSTLMISTVWDVTDRKKAEAELNLAVKQIVSKSIVPLGIVDIFREMRKDVGDISVFSEEFLNDLLKYKHQNVGVAAMTRLLSDQIRARTRKNTTEARKFSEMLEQTINQYYNRKSRPRRF